MVAQVASSTAIRFETLEPAHCTDNGQLDTGHLSGLPEFVDNSLIRIKWFSDSSEEILSVRTWIVRLYDGC